MFYHQNCLKKYLACVENDYSKDEESFSRGKGCDKSWNHAYQVQIQSVINTTDCCFFFLYSQNLLYHCFIYRISQNDNVYYFWLFLSLNKISKVGNNSWGRLEGFLFNSYSFMWITSLYSDTYLIVATVKQGGINYQFFESLAWPVIEPKSTGPLVDTLPTI